MPTVKQNLQLWDSLWTLAVRVSHSNIVTNYVRIVNSRNLILSQPGP